MTGHPVERSPEMPRVPRREATPRIRKRRRIVAGLLVFLIVGAWFEVEHQKAKPSWSGLETAVEQVPVPGAAHPLRIDRWGSDLCALPVPFAGRCPNEDILVASGGSTTPEAYKAAWQDALTRTGWTNHAPDPSVPDAPQGWWTRDHVAIVLHLRADNARGPLFEWLDGQLLLEVHEVGNGMERLPG